MRRQSPWGGKHLTTPYACIIVVLARNQEEREVAFFLPQVHFWSCKTTSRYDFQRPELLQSFNKHRF